MSQVKEGDVVSVHYEGRFEDGEVFDSSKEREPIEFVAGSEQVVPGFSRAVIGMAVGEKKTVTLPPEEAYGDHDPERIQRAPRDLLPENVEVGDQLQAQTEQGSFIVLVTALDDEGATLDANHPLAGRTLVFDLEVVSFGSGAEG